MPRMPQTLSAASGMAEILYDGLSAPLVSAPVSHSPRPGQGHAMSGYWIPHCYGVVYVRAWTRREARRQAWLRGYQVWKPTPRRTTACAPRR
jgi:hypothetical protein